MQTLAQNVLYARVTLFIIIKVQLWLHNMVVTHKTKSLLFMKCYCACGFMYYYNVTILHTQIFKSKHATLTCLLLLTRLHCSARCFWWRGTSRIQSITVEVGETSRQTGRWIFKVKTLGVFLENRVNRQGKTKVSGSAVLLLKGSWGTFAVREWRWGRCPVLTQWERPRGKSCPTPAPQTSSLGQPGWDGETAERKRQKNKPWAKTCNST